MKEFFERKPFDPVPPAAVRWYRNPRYGGGGQRGGGKDYGGRRSGGKPKITLPPETCFPDSFYGDDGFLRREIFIEAAEKAARTFEKEKMSQTSIRSLYQMLKDLDRRVKVDPELKFGEVREQFHRFIRHCHYQNKRNVVPDTFLEFAEKHTDVATKNEKEFHGFVEYLAGILSRMKSKSR